VRDLIVLDPEAASPGFAYKPINRGTIDLWSGYLEGELALGGRGQLTASATVKDLATDGVDPIPHSRWTAAATASLWVASRLRVFARGVALGAREVPVYLPTAEPGPLVTGQRELRPDLRVTAGFALTDLWGGAELDLWVTNPTRRSNEVPLLVDGRPSAVIEERADTELSLALRWTR
jgi:hypothetical protein